MGRKENNLTLTLGFGCGPELGAVRFSLIVFFFISVPCSFCWISFLFFFVCVAIFSRSSNCLGYLIDRAKGTRPYLGLYIGIF